MEIAIALALVIAFFFAYGIKNNRLAAVQAAADEAEAQEGRKAAFDYIAYVGRPVAGGERTYLRMLDWHIESVLINNGASAWRSGYLEVISREYLKYAE